MVTKSTAMWRDGDLRVEVLRHGGALSRVSEDWQGRAQFKYDTTNARSLQDLLRCADQLAHAEFDAWDPAMRLSCPCCMRRRIPDDIAVEDALDRVRAFVGEYGRREELATEAVEGALWEAFQSVDCTASACGFCSLTRSCHQLKPWWDSDHKHVCGRLRSAPPRRRVDARMHDLGSLSRIQFAEGLAQVLALEMSWRTLRNITDALVDARSDRISRGSFARLVRARDPPEWPRKLARKLARLVVREETAERAWTRLAQGREVLSFAALRRALEGADRKELHALFRAYADSHVAACLTREQATHMFFDVVSTYLRSVDAAYLACHASSTDEKRLRGRMAQAKAFLADLWRASQASKADVTQVTQRLTAFI